MIYREAAVRISIGFFVFVMLWSAPARLRAQDAPAPRPVNLLANASFEMLDEKGQPRSWRPETWSGKPVHVVETAFGRSGTRCLKISSTEGADASWSFEASLEPRTRYRLSVWIKTRGLEKRGSHGALVNLHQLQFEGKSDAVHGDREWTRVVGEFNSGSHDRLLVNLLFGGWGRAVGEAWFDDVELVDLTAPLEVLTAEEASARFTEKVYPVLEKRCFSCHGPESKLKGGLFLGSHEGLLRGGDSGPAVDLEQPFESLFVSAVNYDKYEMPPDGKMSPTEIEILTNWVRRGAAFESALESKRPVPEEKGPRSPPVDAAARAFWSFKPPQRRATPRPRDLSWISNPVDAFILDRLEQADLVPAPQATKLELIRRASYDLTGLPPTPEEVKDFCADEAPDAWDRLIDRLLASPHYGERWGRHWLDLVRYAETNSFERDGAKPHVWRYRDYVISAFNDDKPYDRFLLEQLAGDELSEVTPETIIATGYYRLGQWDDEPADPELAFYDEMDDIVSTTSQVFMGLTLNCARCHDHKIDPVPQTDYYRMVAFFRQIRHYGQRSPDSVRQASVRSIASQSVEREHAERVAAHRAAMESTRRRLGEIEEIVKPDFSPVDHEEFKHESNRVSLVSKRSGGVIDEAMAREYEELTKKRRDLRRDRPPGLESALCVKEREGAALSTHVLIRGNPRVPGAEVKPGFPSVLSPPDPTIRPPEAGGSSGRRLALARWVADPSHPLTARVMINRVWQYHFGRGLVRSPNNFGYGGAAPTHPDLLDWLATEFVKRGYRLKAMHRLIMKSSAYRMSTRHDERAFDIDPAGDLYWRFAQRRLSAEEIRDSILAVNHRLDRTMYGPSIYPVIAKEVLAGQSRPGEGWHTSPAKARDRRSIYIHVKRSLVLPLLAAFDAADVDFSCPVRFVSTQPTQALTMLNSDFVHEEAARFADDLIADHPGDPEQQVASALGRTLQRQPTPIEVARGTEFRARMKTEERVDDRATLVAFCVVALNLNEFLYVN